ncbi:MAG: phosphatidylserine decarboxylase family protein, partial [Rhodococcus sp. (in: high G+C Gram-positive bacteria)]
MARKPVPAGSSEPSGPGHFVELIRSSIPPLHPAGMPFVAAPLVIAGLGRRHRLVRTASLLTAGAMAGFFRHPNRVPPNRSGVVVSPADGE